ncbi:hypothetical protein C8A01DRAFT_33183 [Parachaetomium inaequale]|uniref:CFEM domain-containing protein n=1 Tax=Parachaetomium inaequale TaxID=2588326 RepID=A0AAN6SUR4_9PEZI|nr:hypothetical protein C8A01DRAFT_33183 [Parachaetomium inaequale]
MPPFHRLLVLSWALSLAICGACNSLQQLPNCSLPCVATVVPLSICDSTKNIYCICKENDLSQTIARCLEGKCSAQETITVMMLEEKACGKPRRDRKSDFFVSLVIGIPAFLMLLITYIVMHALIQLRVDAWTVNSDALVLGLKLLYVVDILHLVTLTLAKMSILIFFLRLFSAPQIRAATHGVLAFIILANVTLVGMQIFQCMPLEANWEAWRLGYSEPFQCINVSYFAIAAAGLNILQELMLITLPMPALAQLEMSRRAKLSAVGLFALGILTTMMSAIRLAFIIPAADSPNITWDYTDSIIWGGIETAFTLTIPCLPAVRALLSRWSATLAPPEPSSQGSNGSHHGPEPPEDGINDIPLQDLPRDHLHPRT